LVTGSFAGRREAVAHEFANQRIVNCQMEPRAAIGAFDERAPPTR
jgi:hypothetical protein